MDISLSRHNLAICIVCVFILFCIYFHACFTLYVYLVRKMVSICVSAWPHSARAQNPARNEDALTFFCSGVCRLNLPLTHCVYSVPLTPFVHLVPQHDISCAAFYALSNAYSYVALRPSNPKLWANFPHWGPISQIEAQPMDHTETTSSVLKNLYAITFVTLTPILLFWEILLVPNWGPIEAQTPDTTISIV